MHSKKIASNFLIDKLKRNLYHDLQKALLQWKIYAFTICNDRNNGLEINPDTSNLFEYSTKSLFSPIGIE